MELEVKFRCDSVQRVMSKALELGFILKKKKHQIDTYFIVNKKTKYGTRDYLRIREDLSSNSLSLDYHKVLSELETDETEIKIVDKEGIIKILELLGYDIVCVVNKIREQYEKDNVVITVDKVEGLGNFVEIEINEELTDSNRNKIYSIATNLELMEKDRVSKKGYPDLLMEK